MSNKSQVGVHGSEELANLPDRNTVKSQTGGHDKPSTISLGDPIYPHNGPFAHGGPIGDMQRDGMITKEQQRKMIGQNIAANHMTPQELSEYEILEGNKQDYFSETEKEIIREVRFSEAYAKLKGNAE